LRRHAEVVVTDGLPGADAWHEVNGTAASIYHLSADDAIDSPVARLLRLHPGVVVLHDHGPAGDNAGHVSPLLAYVADEAAGVLVHSWPGYAFLQRRRRCPVIYRPAPGAGEEGDDYVRDLLHLVSLARKNRPAALSLRLATRAGAEMSAWMSSLADEAAYRRVAEAIHALVA
ncbi:MAG TPA: hypothetical protein VJ739_11705, partial [Gemmataceae bacterium]|nr:hypothetical protein [Gemmataceae bacterium]